MVMGDSESKHSIPDMLTARASTFSASKGSTRQDNPPMSTKNKGGRDDLAVMTSRFGQHTGSRRSRFSRRGESSQSENGQHESAMATVPKSMSGARPSQHGKVKLRGASRLRQEYLKQGLRNSSEMRSYRIKQKYSRASSVHDGNSSHVGH